MLPLLLEQGSTNAQGVLVYAEENMKTYVKIDARGVAYPNVDHAYEAATQLNIQSHGVHLQLFGNSPPQATEYVNRQINGKVKIIVNNHHTSAFPTENPTQGNPVDGAPHLRTIDDRITIQTHRDIRPLSLNMLLAFAPANNPLKQLDDALQKLKVLASAACDTLPNDEELNLATQRYNDTEDTYNKDVKNTTRVFEARPLSAPDAWARVGNRRRLRLSQICRPWRYLITVVRARLNTILSQASTLQAAKV